MLNINSHRKSTVEDISMSVVNRMVDVHSHILPGIDDGCKTLEETAKVLQQMKAQGINRVIATPHFYAEETPNAFLKRRNEAILKIQALKGLSLPEVYVGAEVAYFDCIGRCESVAKLAIEGTHYILIEMPFCKWDEHIISDINNLSRNYSLVPIIAHVDRYIWKQSRRIVEKLFDTDSLIQIDADSLIDNKLSRKNIKLIEKGIIDLIGSDTHNLTTRAPNMLECTEELIEKGYISAINYISGKSNSLLKNAIRIL